MPPGGHSSLQTKPCRQEHPTSCQSFQKTLECPESESDDLPCLNTAWKLLALCCATPRDDSEDAQNQGYQAFHTYVYWAATERTRNSASCYITPSVFDSYAALIYTQDPYLARAVRMRSSRLHATCRSFGSSPEVHGLSQPHNEGRGPDSGDETF